MFKKSSKGSLRRKIQNSLLVSSFLSILLIVVSLLVIVTGITHPIGALFTATVNDSISKNFMTSFEGALSYQKVDNDFNMFRLKSYDELKNEEFGNVSTLNFKKTDDEILIDFEEAFKDIKENEIYVKGLEDTDIMITEDEKKAILISSVRTVEDIDSFIKITEIFGIDIVNIELQINEKIEFRIPRENYRKVDYANFKNIENIMVIIDRDGNVIGELTTSINSSLLMAIGVFFLIVIILISILVLVIVKIMLMPFGKSIIRPIDKLNRQLNKIASNNLELNEVVIEQKRPPKEINQLIEYSNTIMNKLRDSYHELENHKDEVEAQNMELDVQNAELIASRDALRTAQDRLVQSEKMASMGQLTAAIAHEINTPLGAVTSNSQMMDMMLSKLKKKIEEEAYDEAINIVEKLNRSNNISIDAARRVNEIIRNLRNFSRIDQAEFQNADVNEGIQSVLVLTSNLWKNKVTLKEAYGELPLISCYPSLLNQVFMNVIVNAIQAVDKNGNIKIITELVEDHIRVKIIDDGSGIEEHLLERVFDSGFTTKPKDNGTGLGLSISRDIIKKHHGNISVYNNEEKGVTFEIVLPIEQNHDESCDHD